MEEVWPPRVPGGRERTGVPGSGTVACPASSGGASAAAQAGPVLLSVRVGAASLFSDARPGAWSAPW